MNIYMTDTLTEVQVSCMLICTAVCQFEWNIYLFNPFIAMIINGINYENIQFVFDPEKATK